jgi:hypothetical protein
MPAVVSCPNCRRRSRVPDTLLGKRVKCPGCAEIFTAAAGTPTPPRKQAPVKKPPAQDEAPGYEVVDGDEDSERVADKPRSRRGRADEDEDDERPRRPRRGREGDEDEEDDEPARRPRRRREGEDDDEDEERSRRSRRRLDDDDEDEPPRRPRKKKRRKNSTSFGGLSTAVKVVLGVVGVCLVLSVVGIFVPPVAYVPVALGWLLQFAAGIWLLVIAFQDSALHGLLCLCVPFYSLFYLITHFDDTKNVLFLWLIGFGLLIMGGCSGGVGEVMRGEGRPNRPRAGMQAPAPAVAWS